MSVADCDPVSVPVHCREPGAVVTVPVVLLSGAAANVEPRASLTVKVTGVATAAPRSEMSWVRLIGPGVAAW